MHSSIAIRTRYRRLACVVSKPVKWGGIVADLHWGGREYQVWNPGQPGAAG